MVEVAVHQFHLLFPDQAPQSRRHLPVEAAAFHEPERMHRDAETFHLFRQFTAILNAANDRVESSRVQIAQHAEQHALGPADGQARDQVQHAAAAHCGGAGVSAAQTRLNTASTGISAIETSVEQSGPACG